MTNQAKRGAAAIMIAGGVVMCAGLLVVGRLAPATFSTPIWTAVLGVTFSDLVIAAWLLRTSKG